MKRYCLPSLVLLFSLWAGSLEAQIILVSAQEKCWAEKHRIPTERLSCIASHEGLFPFQLVDSSCGIVFKKYGFVNAKGQPVIPASYDTLLTYFSNGYAVVGKFETYNRSGVRRRKLRTRMAYGVINTHNHVVVPIKFNAVSALPSHLFRVRQTNQLYGVYNIHGSLIPARYESISMPDSHLISATRAKEIHLYSIHGALLHEGVKALSPSGSDSLTITYYASFSLIPGSTINNEKIYADSIASCDRSRILLYRNGISFQTDSTFKKPVVLNTERPCLEPKHYKGGFKAIYDSLALLTDTIKYRFLKNFDQAWEYRDGYACVSKGGMLGFIDTAGNIKISIQYPASTYYQEGLTSVKLKGNWAVIDKEENIIAQPYYQFISYYRHGAAIARLGKKYFLLSKQGKELNRIAYDSIHCHGEAEWLVFRHGLCGIADSTGHELLAPRYQSVSKCAEAYYIAEKDGKYGVVDHRENIIIPFTYSNICYIPYANKFITKTEAGYSSYVKTPKNSHQE